MFLSWILLADVRRDPWSFPWSSYDVPYREHWQTCSVSLCQPFTYVYFLPWSLMFHFATPILMFHFVTFVWNVNMWILFIFLGQQIRLESSLVVLGMLHGKIELMAGKWSRTRVRFPWLMAQALLPLRVGELLTSMHLLNTTWRTLYCEFYRPLSTHILQLHLLFVSTKPDWT